MPGTFSTVIGSGRYRVETRTHEPHEGDVVTTFDVFSIDQEEVLARAGKSPRMSRAGSLVASMTMLDAEFEDLLIFIAQMSARHGRARRDAFKRLLSDN